MKIIKNKKDAIQELERISARTNSENNNKINSIVEEILQEVKNYGDKAVEKFTKKFDGFNPNPMQVSADQLKDAWNDIDDDLRAISENIVNIFNIDFCGIDFIKQDGKYFALEVNSIPAWRGIQSVHDNNITDSFIKCMFE